MKHQFHNSVKILSGVMDRPLARRLSNFRVPTPTRWDTINNPSSFCLRANPEGSMFSYGIFGPANKIRVQSESWRRSLPLSIRASSNSKETNQESGRKNGNFLGRLLKTVVKAAVGALLATFLVFASLPYLLSWSTARRLTLNLANSTIPGTVTVNSVSLGWTKPFHVEGFTLRGSEGEEVLHIPKIESKAPLWSIVLGRSGLGDFTVTSPVIDLQPNPSNGQSRLALALIPEEKLLEKSPRVKRPMKQEKIPPADATLTIQMKSPQGGLEVTGGTAILPGDLAAVLGNRVFVNVDLGASATKESEDLQRAVDQNAGTPVRAVLWSDCAQMEAVGFFQMKTSKIKLIKPLKAEMDLTPAVAKLYLAQLNPLLGEILGPAVQEDDMPDIVVHVTPNGMELPAEHYKINIAPMKVTLARGQVVDGILSLLSKQELAKGKRNLTMQTSVIDAKLDMPGDIDCSRLDILIADRVHVATWGKMNTLQETVKMTLAIPGPSLRDLLGLSKVSPNYYLQIPVSGTFENPRVDWKTAGVGIAQLTARQRGGQLMQSFMDLVDSNEKKSGVPEPASALPWEQSTLKQKE